jgi:hypothetical protein
MAWNADLRLEKGPASSQRAPQVGRRPLCGTRRTRFNRDDSNAARAASGLPGECSGDGVVGEATPETDRLDGLLDLGRH